MDEKRTLKKWRYGWQGYLFLGVFVLGGMGCGWLTSFFFRSIRIDQSQHFQGENSLIVTLVDNEKVVATCDCQLEFEASSYSEFKSLKDQEELPLTTIELVYDDVPAVARRESQTVYLLAMRPYESGPYVFEHEAFTEPVDLEFLGEGIITVETMISDKKVAENDADERQFKNGMTVLGLIFGVIGGVLMCELIFVPPNITIPNMRP